MTLEHELRHTRYFAIFGNSYNSIAAQFEHLVADASGEPFGSSKLYSCLPFEAAARVAEHPNLSEAAAWDFALDQRIAGQCNYAPGFDSIRSEEEFLDWVYATSGLDEPISGI